MTDKIDRMVDEYMATPGLGGEPDAVERAERYATVENDEQYFEVAWSNVVLATSALDAALQAWGMLEDATRHNSGPTWLAVRPLGGGDKQMFDMELDLHDDKEGDLEQG